MGRSTPIIYSTAADSTVRIVRGEEPGRWSVASGGVDGDAVEPVPGQDLPDRGHGADRGIVVGAQVAQDDGLRNLPALEHHPGEEPARLLVGQVPHVRV